MRINKFVASATGLSRRAADKAILDGRVTINQAIAAIGDTVKPDDHVALDNRLITPPVNSLTVKFNKPTGYICSRAGQGGKTIYDILPAKYHDLKPVGRLDKDSSGLLLLTNDGDFANQLTHPSYAKTKIYEVGLDKALRPLHQQMISDNGIELEDGRSQLALQKLDGTGRRWQITMTEGRNRQIRRTFEALGYSVIKLHRTHFGPYTIGNLNLGSALLIDGGT